MSVTLLSADDFSADDAAIDRFVKRSEMTVEQQIVIAFHRARRDGDRDHLRFLRRSARALDPALLDELDGFGKYPAAA
jgi:hypothetical protein